MDLSDNALFFIIYPMDLEDLGLIELEEKFIQHFDNHSFRLVKKIPGGLEIECSLLIGFQLNSILRTATRILLRLTEFKCKDAPKLFLKISKFNWAPWLLGQIPEIESNAINSRLFDSRKIEKAIKDGIQKFYRHKPVKKKYLDHMISAKEKDFPKIYYRAVDDLCTLSLDITGERLHKRGEKILTGLAPIRENLATLLLLELKLHLKEKNISLIDPMCGSATFLIEAYNYNLIVDTRDFAYQHIPLVLDNKLILKKINSSPCENIFKEFLGLEINPEIVNLAKKNCEGLKIEIHQGDLFKQSSTSTKNSAIIVNPPYGIRIGEQGSPDDSVSLDYYLKLISAIKEKFNPVLLGIIIPKDFKLKNNSNFKILSHRPFKNGGIEVVFYILI